jgi:tRNA(Ile)-lysidine synthase TilS/MesJ
MVSCDKCRAGAIIFQRYSGMHLCSAHLEEDIHRKIRESIRETGIFARPARVAVALSGGKDSATLLYALKALFSRRQDIEIAAIVIDEGGEGRRIGTLESARKLAERLEVPCVIRSRNETGETRDELLNRAALDLNADALAMGRNLDDEALAVLQSYLKGDINGLLQLKHGAHHPGEVPIIKPLRRVPDEETALYAIDHEIYCGDCESDAHGKDAMSIEVRKMLNDFESRHPGTKYSLLRSLDRLSVAPHSSTIQGKSL